MLTIGSAMACGGGDDVADTRADQVRTAAADAGLPDDVAEVMVLAARGTAATYQVTYEGQAGASLILSQQPPNRRVDVVAGEVIVESRVFRDGIGYRCQPAADDATGGLRCDRSEGTVQTPGALTDEALDQFASALAEAGAALDLTVEERELAGVTATCLVSAPAAGPTDGRGPGIETLCLSAEGAQLLVDAGGERVVASAYSTTVPAGTFDV